MRIVLGAMQFSGFGGTESYVLTVARQLEALGHDALIHTTVSGPMADFAERLGIRVVRRAGDLPATCDAVFAQDAHAAYELGARYPGAVRVYVMHSAHHPFQSTPPQLGRDGEAIVVMNDRLRRRAEALAWHPPIVRLRQPIDLQRFGTRATTPSSRPQPRVLELGNYIDGPRARMIARACERAGMVLTRVGVRTTPTATPEREIADADIVIALGRGALEAMGGGRAAYVLGTAGGDGWVTPASYGAFEADGFSGRATDAVIDEERLAADLAGWTEGIGDLGRDLIWAHHDAERHAIALVELVRSTDAGAPHPVAPEDELARRVRIEFDSFARAAGAIEARRQIEVQCEELREEARAAHAAVREMHARLLASEAREAELAAQVQRTAHDGTS